MSGLSSLQTNLLFVYHTVCSHVQTFRTEIASMVIKRLDEVQNFFKFSFMQKFKVN